MLVRVGLAMAISATVLTGLPAVADRAPEPWSARPATFAVHSTLDVPVTMSDGVRFYLDAGSGELIATRTPFWRFYDFMWGLHIMDPGGREDSHNPFVIALGIITHATSLMAIVLLPMTRRRRP